MTPAETSLSANEAAKKKEAHPKYVPIQVDACVGETCVCVENGQQATAEIQRLFLISGLA
jgi:hypothetical protein